MGKKLEGLRMNGPVFFLPDIDPQKRKHAIDPSNENPTWDEIRRDLREDAELTMSAVAKELNRMRGPGKLKNKVFGGPNCRGCNRKD